MEDLRIVWKEPSIVGIPTGGNLYNQKIQRILATLTELIVQGPGENDLPNCNSGCVLVVDSLDLQTDFVSDQVRNWEGKAILLAHYLSQLDPSRDLDSTAEVDALQAYDGIVTTSEFAKTRLEAISGTVPVAAIRPGNDTFGPHENGTRIFAGTRILTVANLTPGKGLVEAAEALASASFQGTWRIAGHAGMDRSYAITFENLLESLLPGRYELAGSLSEEALLSEYRKADLLLHPSRFETAGMAILEAAGCGLPVVAFDVGGIRENVSVENAGRLVEADDFVSLAELTLSMMRDPGGSRSLSRANRRHVRALPSWEQQGARFADFAKQLVH